MSGMRRLLETSDRNTFITSIDPRTRIILLVLLATLSIVLDNPMSLLGIFTVVMFLYLFSRLSLEKLGVLFFLLIVGVWGMMLSQALFYSHMPRTVVFTVIPPGFPVIGKLTNGVYLYKEGFRHGAVQSLRFAVTLTFGLLVAWTSQPHQLLMAMVKLKIPYKLAFMTITGIRFLPLIIEESSTVITAQRLRKYNHFSFSKIIKATFHTLSPILANCVRRSTTLSLSIESRAFSASAERTFLTELKYKKIDILVLVVTGSILITSLIIKLTYWLYTTGIYYSSSFRGIYEIANRYL